MLIRSGSKKWSYRHLVAHGARSKSFISKRYQSSSGFASQEHEQVHIVVADERKLDLYLEKVFRTLFTSKLTSVHDLYRQYQHEAGNVIDRVVPYEERPHSSKRADVMSDHHVQSDGLEGDGLVMVVHAQLDTTGNHLEKTTVCSGFVVNASISRQEQGDAIVTCAHTLEEMSRHLKRSSSPTHNSIPGTTFSFIVSSTGQPRPVTRLLSSMPRSDVIVLETQPTKPCSKRLRSLPLTPFPIHPGIRTLTHLFGSPDPPIVKRSIARTQHVLPEIDLTSIEMPVSWVAGNAWRRWGCGQMLGYRSYTGLEVEAGISSVLPHILTSILPMSGSSGGPIVNAETGCVVGMTSGRRMDNRVEGERGWGCSSEGIFEMFSLPGFMPMKR